MGLLSRLLGKIESPEIAGALLGGTLGAVNPESDSPEDILMPALAGGALGSGAKFAARRLLGSGNKLLRDATFGGKHYTFPVGEDHVADVHFDPTFDGPLSSKTDFQDFPDRIYNTNSVTMDVGKDDGAWHSGNDSEMTLPLSTELFKKTYAALEDHTMRYHKPVYQFEGASNAHARLYANSLRRSGPPAGYVGLLTRIGGKPNTISLVRADHADDVIAEAKRFLSAQNFFLDTANDPGYYHTYEVIRRPQGFLSRAK